MRCDASLRHVTWVDPAMQILYERTIVFCAKGVEGAPAEKWWRQPSLDRGGAVRQSQSKRRLVTLVRRAHETQELAGELAEVPRKLGWGIAASVLDWVLDRWCAQEKKKSSDR